MAHPYWPLFDLRVRTPRLELRYPDDELVTTVVDVAATGIHDPATMPFAVPWTDVEPPQFQRNTLQHFWRTRADLSPEKWDLLLAVVEADTVVGVQAIHTNQFAVRRAVETGSWLGRAHQGRGIGKEMRAAVLHLAFAGLGAEWAYTSAWEDNHSSQAVTRALGYESNGCMVDVRRDEAATMLAYRLSRAAWESRRRDDIEIAGLEVCLPLLGL